MDGARPLRRFGVWRGVGLFAILLTWRFMSPPRNRARGEGIWSSRPVYIFCKRSPGPPSSGRSPDLEDGGLCTFRDFAVVERMTGQEIVLEERDLVLAPGLYFL